LTQKKKDTIAENARGDQHLASSVGLLLEQMVLEKCCEISDIFLWYRDQTVLGRLHELK
jgi:hypothetical protein